VVQNLIHGMHENYIVENSTICKISLILNSFDSRFNHMMSSTFVERNVSLVQLRIFGPWFEFGFGPIEGLYAWINIMS